MDDRELTDTLRDQMSNLCSVFALSMMLFDSVDEEEILKLTTSSVPALGPFQAEGTYLVRDDLRRGTDGSAMRRDQLAALAGADGQVDVVGTTWAWAYPLRAVGGHAGYLVVSSGTGPSPHEEFLIKTLAQQAGAALTSATLFRSERIASAELRETNAELASVNDELTLTVAALERRTQMHETLSRVAATGGAEPGIAAALATLTGLAVVLEDQFGNVLAWAGRNEPPHAKSRLSARARTELLSRIQRSGRPMRDRDRIIALAQPRDEVLGVLVLIDPDHRAGRLELFALEHAAVILAMELAHQRSLAETELRLRADLVDDLLTGTDDDSALARSAALGHDLRPPHQVLVVSWPSIDNEEKVSRAVDQEATRITQARALLTRRSGQVVLIAPAREGDDCAHNWDELYRRIKRGLPSAKAAIGVGQLCPQPSDLPRSYTQALHALRIRRASTTSSGVTTFEDLGFYRMLGSGESTREVSEFIREWLGPLIDYDEIHHYDLVSTLWQYCECGGNYDATARALLIHRSTLRYRLRRIRELTGHDLGTVDTRLNLHIATRGWRILHGPS
jgi:sugar diacid utilization regulator